MHTGAQSVPTPRASPIAWPVTGVPGPDGTGQWIAHSPRSPLDDLEPDEWAVVDLDRPGLDEGEGMFLVVWRCGDRHIAYVACGVDPLTKRGRLRRWVRTGGIRFDAATYGTRWWLYRVRQIGRAIGPGPADSLTQHPVVPHIPAHRLQMGHYILGALRCSSSGRSAGGSSGSTTGPSRC